MAGIGEFYLQIQSLLSEILYEPLVEKAGREALSNFISQSKSYHDERDARALIKFAKHINFHSTTCDYHIILGVLNKMAHNDETLTWEDIDESKRQIGILFAVIEQDYSKLNDLFGKIAENRGKMPYIPAYELRTLGKGKMYFTSEGDNFDKAFLTIKDILGDSGYDVHDDKIILDAGLYEHNKTQFDELEGNWGDAGAYLHIVPNMGDENKIGAFKRLSQKEQDSMWYIQEDKVFFYTNNPTFPFKMILGQQVEATTLKSSHCEIVTADIDPFIRILKKHNVTMIEEKYIDLELDKIESIIDNHISNISSSNNGRKEPPLEFSTKQLNNSSPQKVNPRRQRNRSNKQNQPNHNPQTKELKQTNTQHVPNTQFTKQSKPKSSTSNTNMQQQHTKSHQTKPPTNVNNQPHPVKPKQPKAQKNIPPPTQQVSNHIPQTKERKQTNTQHVSNTQFTKQSKPKSSTSNTNMQQQHTKSHQTKPPTNVNNQPHPVKPKQPKAQKNIPPPTQTQKTKAKSKKPQQIGTQTPQGSVQSKQQESSSPYTSQQLLHVSLLNQIKVVGTPSAPNRMNPPHFKKNPQ